MQKGFSGIHILIGLALLLGGLYYFGKLPLKLPFSQSQSPAPVKQQAVKTEETADWRMYTDKDISFKYPPDWTIIDSYTFKGNANREDMILKCPGPIIQNTHNKTTLIAVDSINLKDRPDGGNCWSTGVFKDVSKRTITIVNPPQEISVSQWIPGITLRFNENEKASLLFQTYSFNKFSATYPSKNWYEFALIFEKGKDSTAEQTFDQILSTLRFY